MAGFDSLHPGDLPKAGRLGSLTTELGKKR
jgi:hypothetical protein